MASVSEIFHVKADNGDARIVFGLAINEIAIDVVKKQRLRVFKQLNYYEPTKVDDDDEFESKTVYFVAYVDRDDQAGATDADKLEAGLVGQYTSSLDT
jgi:hypothetical protein